MHSFLRFKKILMFFFAIYIYIYIYIFIYLYISLYISIYLYIFIYIYTVYIYIYFEKRTQSSAFLSVLLQKNKTFSRSLQKNKTFSAFFYILCKRMLCSLCSFTLLRKESIVLLGLISGQKLEKRM